MTNQMFRDYLDGDTPGPLVYSAEESQVILNLFKSAGSLDTADELGRAPQTQYGYSTSPIVYDEASLRPRALAAKQRQGKGPPSALGWRGRERNTKYRSQ